MEKMKAAIFYAPGDYLDAPILRIAAPNTPPPSSSVLEKAFLPSERDVIAGIKELIRYSPEICGTDVEH